MICPKCSTDNLDEAKFCIKCGTPLDEKDDAQKPVSKPQTDWRYTRQPSGALPGLVIGVIIIIIGITSVFGGDFGEIMGNWGENFGEFMGNWGEGVGRFFADWGTSWGSRIGASILIIIGLAIVYHFMYGRGRR